MHCFLSYFPFQAIKKEKVDDQEQEKLDVEPIKKLEKCSLMRDKPDTEDGKEVCGVTTPVVVERKGSDGKSESE